MRVGVCNFTAADDYLRSRRVAQCRPRGVRLRPLPVVFVPNNPSQRSDFKARSADGRSVRKTVENGDHLRLLSGSKTICFEFAVLPWSRAKLAMELIILVLEDECSS